MTNPGKYTTIIAWNGFHIKCRKMRIICLNYIDILKNRDMETVLLKRRRQMNTGKYTRLEIFARALQTGGSIRVMSGDGECQKVPAGKA